MCPFFDPTIHFQKFPKKLINAETSNIFTVEGKIGNNAQQ